MTLADDPDDPRPDDPDDPVDYKRAASNAVRHSEKSSQSVYIEAKKPQEEHSEKSSRSVYIEAEKPQEEPKHLIYRQERSDNRDILTWLN